MGRSDRGIGSVKPGTRPGRKSTRLPWIMHRHTPLASSHVGLSGRPTFDPPPPRRPPGPLAIDRREINQCDDVVAPPVLTDGTLGPDRDQAVAQVEPPAPFEEPGQNVGDRDRAGS